MDSELQHCKYVTNIPTIILEKTFFINNAIICKNCSKKNWPGSQENTQDIRNQKEPFLTLKK